MKDQTDITILLDRSGSMHSIKDDVVGGFNDFVAEQKKTGPNATLTLVQFDSTAVETLHSAVPISDVPLLTGETYQPRAMTPLLDALGSTIHKTGERLGGIDEVERPDKVVFLIITDGLENASREFSKAAVRALIEQQTNTYNWQFVYLGANQDAFHEAGQMGIAAAATADFAPQNMRASYQAMSMNVGNYRRTGRKRALGFTKTQRDSLKRPS